MSAAKLCEPVFAAVLAGILFGEIPDPAEWISGGMVLAGVLLYTYTERWRKAAGTPCVPAAFFLYTGSMVTAVPEAETIIMLFPEPRIS